jgi:hypothetical protein
MNRRSNRALLGSELPYDKLHVYARNLEVPAGGAVATARAIAGAYNVFANGGLELGLRPDTLSLLSAPAIRPTRGFYDECLKADGVQFSLGFMKSSPAWSFGTAGAFGAPGARWLSWFRRSEDWTCVRLCDEQDRDSVGRRSTGYCSQRRTAFGAFDFRGSVGRKAEIVAMDFLTVQE